MQTLDFRTWRPVSPSERITPETAEKPPRRSASILRWLATAVVAFVLTSILLVLVYRWVPVSMTPLMLIRVSENILTGKPVRFERDWVPLTELSPKLQRSVVAAEDIKFFEHEGFDWEAIEKAIRHNKMKKNGKRIRGGSTISQQVAKNVFLWPKRSWVRKGLEAYFTVLIEKLWGKERIMEVYLNVVELGDGIYGVEAASEKYFKKSAKDLSSSEAALMAAVLPNPRYYSVQRPSPYTRFRQTMIQRRMPIAARTFGPKS